jgi:hypothetical protein
MSFSTLRQQPESALTELLALVDRLIHADSRVDVFEYALARLLSIHLNDALRPGLTRTSGQRKLADNLPAVRNLLAILARHGHRDPVMANAALSSGLKVLGIAAAANPEIGAAWPDLLDAALVRLDELAMQGKQQLLRALVATVSHDGEVVPSEMELLRAVCASLHVPLPGRTSATS